MMPLFGRPSGAGIAMLAAGCCLAIACQEAQAPELTPPKPLRTISAGPTVLTFAPGTPALAGGGLVSAWVIAGQPADLRLRFADGDELAHLRLNPNSLDRYPDGRAIAPGDSVLITMRLAPGDSMLIDFQPSGLTFDARHPAQLTFSYQEADDDLNRNGRHHDEDDAAIEERLAIWHQSQPGAALDPRPTVHDHGHKALDADITGFSRYAIAY